MYAPLQVQAYVDGTRLRVFLVNDRVTPVLTTVYVSLLSLNQTSTTCPTQRAWHSFGVAPVLRQDYQVQPSFASQVWSTQIATLLRSRPGCKANSCYVSVTAVAKSNQPGAGDVSETQLWLVPLKDITFPNPELKLAGFQYGDIAAAADPLPAPAAPAAAPIAAPADAAAVAGRALLEEEVLGSIQADAIDRLRTRFSSGAAPPPAPAQDVAAVRKPRVRRPGSVSHGGLRVDQTLVPQRAWAPAGTPITFTMSANRPAALTQLLTKYRGRFSDDALTAVHPCEPQMITFYPHVSVGPLAPEDLAADLKVTRGVDLLTCVVLVTCVILRGLGLVDGWHERCQLHGHVVQHFKACAASGNPFDCNNIACESHQQSTRQMA